MTPVACSYIVGGQEQGLDRHIFRILSEIMLRRNFLIGIDRVAEWGWLQVAVMSQAVASYSDA